MKYTLTIILVFFLTVVFTQTPSSFPYQGYISDIDGNPISNRTIDFIVSITDDTQGISILYSENHQLETDDNGLFNFIIGRGSNPSGEFDMVEWFSNQTFIGIDYNLNDGNGMQTLGYDFIHSVPFALHAKYIISCVNGLNGPNGLQGLQGATGPQGAQGPQGEQGLPGIEGPSANNGLPILPILSTPPLTPSFDGVIYLDDGTNRDDSKPGFRYFDGTNWIDL